MDERTVQECNDSAFANLAAEAAYNGLQYARGNTPGIVPYWNDITEEERAPYISRAVKCIELVRGEKDRFYELDLSERLPVVLREMRKAMGSMSGDESIARSSLTYVMCNIGSR